GDAGVEALAPQHDQHAVLGLGNEEDFHPVDPDAVTQLGHDGRGLVVGDAPGPAVGDVPGAVQRGQVAPGSYVAGLQLDVQAGRAQRTAPELVLEGVVAEEPEVAGP